MVKAHKPHPASLLPIILLAVIALLFAGCAKTGIQRAEKTSKSMQEVEDQIVNARTQIDVTSSALDRLTWADEANLRKAYEQYSVESEKMKEIGEDLTKNLDEMRARGREYFSEWRDLGKTYTNPEIRALSEERRVELNQLYAQIADSSIGVRGNLQAYLTDLEEIRKFLSNDLTRRGVDAISPVAERAIRDGDSLKQSIRPMMSTIARVRSAMTPAVTK